MPWRYGPDYTDAQARRAVASIYAKGIIRTNYALPAGPWKHSYCGRGLVQITWYDNYRELGEVIDLPLAQYPDLALTWDAALPLLFVGLAGGLYTGRELPDDFDITDTQAVTNYRQSSTATPSRTAGPLPCSRSTSMLLWFRSARPQCARRAGARSIMFSIVKQLRDCVAAANALATQDTGGKPRCSLFLTNRSFVAAVISVVL